MIYDEINICDDEKTEFLNNSNNYSKCYVCLNYTLLLSPCKCKSPICNDCFVIVVKKNGDKCTICKNEFDENIIKDIIIETNDDESSNDESSNDDSLDSFENQYNQDTNLISYKCFKILKLLAVIILIPFIGLMFNQLNYNRGSEIFTLDNFLIGALIVSFILLFCIIMYSFNYFFDYLSRICSRNNN